MIQNNYQGALQHPIGSGFNNTSTAQEVIRGIDLTGKTAIVTGGNTGIGLETVKMLAGAGATVVVAARDIEKARKNLEDIPNVEPAFIDFADPATIDAFAASFCADNRALHLLINNAGTMWVPLRRDSRGIESQLAINYLGQFQLTARLWPALLKANGARVVNVSSIGHQLSHFRFDDPNFEHTPYETLVAYGQSKTASNLFAMELDARAQQYGVRAYSLHPGAIYGTELGREAPSELFRDLGYTDEEGNILPEVIARLKTIPQGAATTVWCATSPRLNEIGGVYCEDGDIATLIPASSQTTTAELQQHKGVSEYSLDEADARRLWTWSEGVTGLSFRVI